MNLEALKPRKKIVPLQDFQKLSSREYLIQRKYDGEFATREIMFKGERFTLLGEKLRAKSSGLFDWKDKALLKRHYGSFFVAFSVDLPGATNRDRWLKLSEIALSFTEDCYLADTVSDASFCMESGGEGVCAHAWDAPWGEMLCVKQLNTWLCKVTAIGFTQSVEIADAATGEPRGNVKLGGGKCDRVRVGSVIKIEGMGLSDSGKIREPRPCADTETSWLVSQ